MKMFVWQNVKKLTGNWHDRGGCAVVAESLEDARALLVQQDVKADCGALTEEPDGVYDLDGEPDKTAWIFPDAGCC